jgi:hypothetical protein
MRLTIVTIAFCEPDPERQPVDPGQPGDEGLAAARA